VLIAHQFGVSIEGVVNATNMLVKEAQIILKNIAEMDEFAAKSNGT
jgi:hypothetical protein